MISTLQAFLISAAKESGVFEQKISERIETPFKIRALSIDEWQEIQRLSVNIHGGISERVSSIEILKRAAIAGSVDPDFKAAEFIEQCGAHTPEEALKKVLNAGEIVTLGNAVLKVSGFAESLEEARREAQD